ncbi:MAG TPA: DUF456 domain-containing protein [Syntrophomonadaceae bacterium]|nr:DUF456 domain-containing protein [Syntrophomonadaceae bacterium]
MNTAVLIIALLFILVGIAGTFLPVLPGVALIFAAIAAYGWYEGFQSITAGYLMVLAGLTVISMLVDYLSAYWGAKYFDSSRLGMWGAVLGSVVGIFLFPPLGILICPWLGAVGGELIQGHEYKKAMKSGLGAVIGLFSGIAFKVAIGIGMLVSFLILIF